VLVAHARAGVLAVLMSACLWTAAHCTLPSKPLPGEVCPTSAFGSYRSGHLHAGIDFSTGGRTGVPVLAVDSCWVWRIRIWNGGYGKALYAQLSDGKIAVYGHLSRYPPEIEDLVEEEQDLRGAYEVEIYFEANAFKFLPGDTIGFSGETGSGPPHLHFELRSGRHDHMDVNPFPDYLDLAESIPPRIKTLRFTPLTAASALNGDHHPLVIACETEPDTLLVSGPFGVSVSAVDGVQCGRTLSPVIYEAWIDEVPVWGLDLDRFPFAKSHFIGSIYHVEAGRRFVRLFDPYGLDFSGFTCLAAEDRPPASGLGEGRHVLSVHVADAWGNLDSINVPFYYGHTPDFASFELNDDSLGVGVLMVPGQVEGGVEFMARHPGGPWEPVEIPSRAGAYTGRIAEPGPYVEVRCTLTGAGGFTRTCVLAHGPESSADSVDVETVLHADYLEIYAHSTRAPSSLPQVHIYEGSTFETALLQPVGGNSFRAAYCPAGTDQVIHLRAEFDFGASRVEKTEGFAIARIMPGKRVWLLGDGFKVRLSAPAGYRSSTLVRLSEEPASSRKGFEENLGRLVLEPAGVFFNERVELLVVSKVAGPTPKYGAFADRGSACAFLGRFDSTGVAFASLRTLEPLVILEDLEPPSVIWKGGLVRRPGDGKGVFSARVADGGSGLDVGSLEAYIDGEVAIVSYDPDTGRVGGRSTKPLQSGPHRLRLVARDRMGNSTTSETTSELAR
jgi:hypothetical protein